MCVLRVLARVGFSCMAVLLSSCAMLHTNKHAKPYEAFVYLDRTTFVFPYNRLFKPQETQFTADAASDLRDIVVCTAA